MCMIRSYELVLSSLVRLARPSSKLVFMQLADHDLSLVQKTHNVSGCERGEVIWLGMRASLLVTSAFG